MYRLILCSLAILFGFTIVPAEAYGQSAGAALFVLLPVGSTAVGKGEAVVARKGGTEQLWWNPAGIVGGETGATRAPRREIALHHSQTIVGQGNALASVVQLPRYGSVGVFLNLLDMGAQTATDEYGNPQGRISTTDLGFGIAYAYQLTPFLALGATAKGVQSRVGCSGLCTDLPEGSSGEYGIDVGAVISPAGLPLNFGMAFRHLGIGEAGSRPARVDVGVQYRVEVLERYTQLVKLNTSVSAVGTPGFDSVSGRFGAEIIVEDWIFVRSGYILDRQSGSGASIGFGVKTGKVGFNISRTFGGISGTGESPPTYFSLQYAW